MKKRREVNRESKMKSATPDSIVDKRDLDQRKKRKEEKEKE